jgi:dUTP pyrophosphatase
MIAKPEEAMVMTMETKEEPKNKNLTIKYIRKPEVKITRRIYATDAGIDLVLTEDIEIGLWELYKTTSGLKFQIPEGYYGQLYPRSSAAKRGLKVEGGVIDASFRGEIQFLLSNRDPRTAFNGFKGDYIIQMVIHKIYEGELEEVEKLDNTTRGEGGFGSTDALALVSKKQITETQHEQQKKEKHGYQIGERTTEEQKEQIKALMMEFEVILATTFEDIRAVGEPKFKHHIDIG